MGMEGIGEGLGEGSRDSRVGRWLFGRAACRVLMVERIAQ